MGARACLSFFLAIALFSFSAAQIQVSFISNDGPVAPNGQVTFILEFKNMDPAFFAFSPEVILDFPDVPKNFSFVSSNWTCTNLKCFASSIAPSSSEYISVTLRSTHCDQAGQMEVSIKAASANINSSPVFLGGVPIRTTVNVGPMFVKTSTQITNVKCRGLNTGAISVTLTGGKTPYDKTSLSGLSANTHTLKSTDATGCIVFTQVTITQPDEVLYLEMEAWPAGSNLSPTPMFMHPSGGVPPYAYSWQNGDSTESTTFPAPQVGSVWGAVTDSAGCVRNMTRPIRSYASVFTAAMNRSFPYAANWNAGIPSGSRSMEVNQKALLDQVGYSTDVDSCLFKSGADFIFADQSFLKCYATSILGNAHITGALVGPADGGHINGGGDIFISNQNGNKVQISNGKIFDYRARVHFLNQGEVVLDNLILASNGFVALSADRKVYIKNDIAMQTQFLNYGNELKLEVRTGETAKISTASTAWGGTGLTLSNLGSLKIEKPTTSRVGEIYSGNPASPIEIVSGAYVEAERFIGTFKAEKLRVSFSGSSFLDVKLLPTDGGKIPVLGPTKKSSVGYVKDLNFGSSPNKNGLRVYGVCGDDVEFSLFDQRTDKSAPNYCQYMTDVYLKDEFQMWTSHTSLGEYVKGDGGKPILILGGDPTGAAPFTNYSTGYFSNSVVTNAFPSARWTGVSIRFHQAVLSQRGATFQKGFLLAGDWVQIPAYNAWFYFQELNMDGTMVFNYNTPDASAKTGPGTVLFQNFVAGPNCRFDVEGTVASQAERLTVIFDMPGQVPMGSCKMEGSTDYSVVFRNTGVYRLPSGKFDKLGTQQSAHVTTSADIRVKNPLDQSGTKRCLGVNADRFFIQDTSKFTTEHYVNNWGVSKIQDQGVLEVIGKGSLFETGALTMIGNATIVLKWRSPCSSGGGDFPRIQVNGRIDLSGGCTIPGFQLDLGRVVVDLNFVPQATGTVVAIIDSNFYTGNDPFQFDVINEPAGVFYTVVKNVIAGIETYSLVAAGDTTYTPPPSCQVTGCQTIYLGGDNYAYTCEGGEPQDTTVAPSTSLDLTTDWKVQSFTANTNTKIKVQASFEVTGTMTLDSGAEIEVDLAGNVTIAKLDAKKGAIVKIKTGGLVVVVTDVVSDGGSFSIGKGGRLVVQGNVALGGDTVLNTTQNIGGGPLQLSGKLTLTQAKIFVAILEAFNFNTTSRSILRTQKSTQTVQVASFTSLEGTLDSATGDTDKDYSGSNCDKVTTVTPQYSDTTLSVLVTAEKDSSVPGCSTGLSPGAIAGIAVGCAAVAIGATVGLVFALKRRDQQRTEGIFMSRMASKF